ncbi:MAG: 4Fe-4S cluster-binding domain-containing protein [Oscillospiraceae bacterium]
MGTLPVIARAAKHFWEEPCISGTLGSGAVFFSGCPLKCIYCQNHEISIDNFGKEINISRLREIFQELIDDGIHNINLVNPTHFATSISIALEPKLSVPIVYNSSGYEEINTLKLLNGKIDIYIPDMKYSINSVAKKYSNAFDYPSVAKKAIYEMFEQTGAYKIDDYGIMQSGVIIRHLILPENIKNSFGVIDWVAKTFPRRSILFSLMSQYTPINKNCEYSELNRRITQKEYNEVEQYLFDSGIEDGFMQDLSSSKSQYIPCFDLTGV